MFSVHNIVTGLGLAVVICPVLVLILLGLAALFSRPVSERTMVRLVESSTVIGLLASVGILVIMLVTGHRNEPIDLGQWVHIGDPDHSKYHFLIRFVFDRLSVPFVILSFVLCGTIGAFASRYMHREPGFTRFFFLFALFVVGMIVTSLAGTIETLFAGWEMVGLSSALLVAFYHERPSPVRNGLRVWAIYRFSDAALLTAAVVLHKLKGHGDFSQFLGDHPWPDGITTLTQGQALVVGLLLVIAAAGKSALVPFSGWLPRAMEGPTPSSAVFYGALSVHLGTFLLLRLQPLLAKSETLQVVVISLGLITALFAALAQRVQTDIKCALSFASLTQVGIITAEIGFGFSYLALVHILGHACLRTLQFIRAPTLLADYRVLENAIGTRLPASKRTPFGRFSEGIRDRLYRLALERGYLDALLNDYIVRPFLALFRRCDALERRWTNYLNGTTGEPEKPRNVVIEDIP
jgi:NADH-quinone oxidoreductase subunit L